MEVSNQLVSWVITYLGNLQPTYIGVITQLLSTMDIPVQFQRLSSKRSWETWTPTQKSFSPTGLGGFNPSEPRKKPRKKTCGYFLWNMGCLKTGSLL